MRAENSTFIVNRQKLIELALELERQETVNTALIFQSIDQLEDIRCSLSSIIDTNRTSKPLNDFLSLFIPSQELDNLITDQLIEQWTAEANKLKASTNTQDSNQAETQL